MKVGGSTNVKVDVRVIAATNKNLPKMVSKSSFREDLFFRLKAVTLQLPSLKERLVDIPLFLMKFSADSAKKYRRDQLIFDKDALSEIMNHHWKGNIRELKNFIDMLTVMETGKTVSGEIIRKYLKTEHTASYLPMLIHDEPQKDTDLIFKTLLEIKSDLNLIKKFILETYSSKQPQIHYRDEIKEIIDPEREIVPTEELSEKDEIIMTLKKHRGNRRKAAEELNLSERTLYRKIEKYGIVI